MLGSSCRDQCLFTVPTLATVPLRLVRHAALTMQPQTCSVPPFEQPGDATHATLSRRARHRCAGNSRRGRPIAIGDGAPLHQQSSALTKETRAIFLVHGSTATAFPDASSTVCMFPHTQLRNCLLCEWFIHNPDFWRVRCWPSFLPTIATLSRIHTGSGHDHRPGHLRG